MASCFGSNCDRDRDCLCPLIFRSQHIWEAASLPLPTKERHIQTHGTLRTCMTFTLWHNRSWRLGDGGRERVCVCENESDTNEHWEEGGGGRSNNVISDDLAHLKGKKGEDDRRGGERNLLHHLLLYYYYFYWFPVWVLSTALLPPLFFCFVLF